MITIEFIVKNSQGVEKLRTTDEIAARDYDRMLDAAEKIMPIIESSGLELSEQATEELAIHLIKNSDTLLDALKTMGTARKPRGPYNKKGVNDAPDSEPAVDKEEEGEPMTEEKALDEIIGSPKKLASNF